MELSVGTLSKVVEESAGGTNLETKFRLADADDSNICLDRRAEHEFNDSFINKVIRCFCNSSLELCFTLFVLMRSKFLSCVNWNYGRSFAITCQILLIFCHIIESREWGG